MTCTCTAPEWDCPEEHAAPPPRRRRWFALRALLRAWLEGFLPWCLAGLVAVSIVAAPLACTDPLYLEEAVILGVGFDFGEQEDRNAAPAVARCVLALGEPLDGLRVSLRRDVAQVCRVPDAPKPAQECALIDGLIVLPVAEVFPASLFCHGANHWRLSRIEGMGRDDPKHVDASWPAADGAAGVCR